MPLQGSSCALHQQAIETLSTLAGARAEARLKEAAEQLKGRVLFQDAQLLVIDKPAGLPVQGGPGALPEQHTCRSLTSEFNT